MSKEAMMGKIGGRPVASAILLMVVLLIAGASKLCGQTADVNRDGVVDLQDYAQVQIQFDGPSRMLQMDMELISAAGSPPNYDFLIGKFEVTKGQFVRFLNDVDRDAGATWRGAFMVVHDSGKVTIPDGSPVFDPGGERYVRFNPCGEIGGRYSVLPGMMPHPITGVTWIGTAKFCNWLTLQSGTPDENPCYTEGPLRADWRPVSITAERYQLRDLDFTERQMLVQECRGYRLPMDEAAGLDARKDSMARPYGEWYKAATYDLNAPGYVRYAPSGAKVPALHWTYGFGRDVLTIYDACNLLGTCPVGHYNGANDAMQIGIPGCVPAFDTDNPYGLHDFTANVRELMLDRYEVQSDVSHAARGGSYHDSFSSQQEATSRWSQFWNYGDARTGFRVVRVPGQNFSKIFPSPP